MSVAGASGWRSRTSAGISVSWAGGRLAGSDNAAKVSSVPGARAAAVSTVRPRDTSPRRTCAQAASRRRRLAASSSSAWAVGAGPGWSAASRAAASRAVQRPARKSLASGCRKRYTCFRGHRLGGQRASTKPDVHLGGGLRTWPPWQCGRKHQHRQHRLPCCSDSVRTKPTERVRVPRPQLVWRARIGKGCTHP